MKDFIEEIKVFGNELVDKVRALIHEGNVRRIIIKNEQGHTFIEIPVTVAAIGVVFAPILAAVGAIAALAAHFTVVVERSGAGEPSGPSATSLQRNCSAPCCDCPVIYFEQQLVFWSP